MLIHKTISCNDCGFSGSIQYADETLAKYTDIQFCPICSGTPEIEDYVVSSSSKTVAIQELEKQ